jgi:hypothetical protein
MSDTCGPMFEMPLAQYDPDERCWKTSEVTSLWALPMSSLTLPAWGCLRDGALFEQPTPELLTTGHGFLSLPTPRAQNGEPRNQTIYKREGPQNLENALALLPTPAVNDMGAGKDPQAWDDWTQRMRQAHGNGNGHGKSLEQEALKMLPTPTAVCRDRSQEQLNRRWMHAEPMTRGPNLDDMPWVIPSRTGAGTHQPLIGGSASLDAQHQLPLFTETSETA